VSVSDGASEVMNYPACCVALREASERSRGSRAMLVTLIALIRSTGNAFPNFPLSFGPFPVYRLGPLKTPVA